MRFAVINDIHHGREELSKGVNRKLSRYSKELLIEFIEKMNTEIKPDFLVQLGDVVQDANYEEDTKNFKEVVNELKKLNCPVYHLVGNHDYLNIPEKELLTILNYKTFWYSCDNDKYHLIFLYSRQRPKNNITVSDEQVRWFSKDLEETNKKTLIFIHHSLANQNIKGNFWFDGRPDHCLVKQREEIRALIENSGKVIAVFNAHLHWNNITVHKCIPYITVQSLVENFNNDEVPSKSFTIVDLNEKYIYVKVYGNDGMEYKHYF